MSGIEPHLSQRELSETIKWFTFYAEASVHADSLEVMRQRQIREQAYGSDYELNAESLDKTLDYVGAQKALMHLCLFLTLEKVGDVHSAVRGIGPDSTSEEKEEKKEERVTIVDFKEMVANLTLMGLSLSQKRYFAALFRKHSTPNMPKGEEEQNMLSREGLKAVMLALRHPEVNDNLFNPPYIVVSFVGQLFWSYVLFAICILICWCTPLHLPPVHT